MKKVAICLTGHIRNYNNYFHKLYENIILNNSGKFEFDVLVSTWSNINSKNSHSHVRRNNTDFSKIDISELYSVINPKIILVEKEEIDIFKKFENISGTNITKSVFSQFYKVNQIFKFLEEYQISNQINYKYIIRSRFDFEIFNKINLEEIDPNFFNVEDETYDMDWISDKFCITNFNNFKIFSNFYSELENLILENGTNIPEKLMAIHFKKNNIEVKKNKILNPYSWPPRY
jgi:hypothetical protein